VTLLTNLPACIIVAGLLFGMALSGCSALARRDAVPVRWTQEAQPIEAPGSRYWPDLESPSIEITTLPDVSSPSGESDPIGRPNGQPTANYLALSGGGDNGAFGAGLLVGWTAQGTRPSFDVVAGVSAGALIAPFAFLGSQYDNTLRRLWSTIGSNDIFHVKNIYAALTSDGLTDDRPLAALIATYVTADLLAKIAEEYAKGRLLFIGTTDLDAEQPVIWDMGAIASSKSPHALELFRKIMLASTSLPGLFPPVMIDVDLAGKHYQEMHVDGGVMRTVFMLPTLFARTNLPLKDADSTVRHIFVIDNQKIQRPWTSTHRRTGTIALRALDAMGAAESQSDLYRLQVLAHAEGAELSVAYLGPEFTYPHRSMFATDYMAHLFDFSCRLAAAGTSWLKTPFGTQESVVAQSFPSKTDLEGRTSASLEEFLRR
jgi:predicted acylesterase/phospholipase RssA